MRFGRHGPSLGAILMLCVAVTVLAGGDCSGWGGGPKGDGPTGGGVAPGKTVEAEVERVIDGDTIEVSLSGEEEDVRYIGIDTPESVAPGRPVECFGKEASRENERLVGGETVRLVFDAERRDRYGRLLAYVYVGKRFINAALIEGGFATTLEIEPNTSRADRLASVEREAGREGVGGWDSCPSF